MVQKLRFWARKFMFLAEDTSWWAQRSRDCAYRAQQKRFGAYLRSAASRKQHFWSRNGRSSIENGLMQRFWALKFMFLVQDTSFGHNAAEAAIQRTAEAFWHMFDVICAEKAVF